MEKTTLLIAFCAVPVTQAQQLTAVQAKSHEGETATLSGIVASSHTSSGSNGKPTFINLDAPYRRQIFTILIWDDDRSNIGGSSIEFTNLRHRS